MKPGLLTSFISVLAQATLVTGLCLAAPAHARRLALVMGNDNYTSVVKLQKAGNDAVSMAHELRAAGFDVQLHKDLNYRGMVKAVEAFTSNITGGDEVVVFYAGHGVQIKTGSYLLPTDIEASSESEVEKTAYELNALTDKISESKPGFTLVMVDACRDNPLKSRGRSVGAVRGLSAIEPAKGQMVVYSASRGQQALDRLSESDPNPNGVFTREFVAQMKRPGFKIEEIMREVQDSVEALAKTVNHEQRPAIYNEARGNFYFFGPTIVQAAPSLSSDPSAVELVLWDSAKTANTAAEVQAYLNRFPNGFFAEMATARIAAINRTNETRVTTNSVQKEAQERRIESESKESNGSQATRPVAAPQASIPKPGAVLKDCDLCPELVVIPAGTFQMGSAGTGFLGLIKPVTDETPQHQVALKTFAMGKYEVTQEEWFAVMGTMPSNFKGRRLPVEQVSWSDIHEYLKKLTQQTGHTYRLPTEAEWEYAARAGTQTTYSFGNSETDLTDHAWGIFNAQGTTHPVGEKKPNPFGLHDMHGNVWEWTQDCWIPNYDKALADGSAYTQENCASAVIRGGSWSNNRLGLRVTYRYPAPYGLEGDHVGFRVVRNP